MKRRVDATRKIETPAQREAFGDLDPSNGGASDAAAERPAPVTRELIQARAYEIYLARDGGSGDAISDWLQAEREIGSSERQADQST